MNLKKLISMLLIVCLTATLAMGCSGKQTADTQGSTDTADTSGSGESSDSAVAPEDMKAELTLWDASWNEGKTEQMIAKFNETYPNIKINVEFFPSDGMSDKYLVALTGGSGPDLVSINNEWVSTYAAAGGLLDLQTMINNESYDLTDFYDGALQGVTYNGDVYALPYRAETHGLFYNAKLFKDAGYDTIPETWEEMTDALKAVTKGDVKGIAIPAGEWGNTTYQLINMILLNGGSILSEDNTACTLDSEEAVEAAKYFVSLYRDAAVVPDSLFENDNAAGRTLFINGLVGCFMTGAYDISTIKDTNPDLELATAMIPTFGDNPDSLIFAGWSTGVASYTKYPEAAWLFAQFLASAENSVDYSTTFSARKSAAETYAADPLLAPLVEEIQYGRPLPVIPELTQIRQGLYEQIQLALAGEITPEEAMATAAERANSLLQK